MHVHVCRAESRLPVRSRVAPLRAAPRTRHARAATRGAHVTSVKVKRVLQLVPSLSPHAIHHAINLRPSITAQSVPTPGHGHLLKVLLEFAWCLLHVP